MAQMNVLYKHAAVMVWLVAGNIAALYAQAEAQQDSSIKAVFLHNLTQFVEWPPSAFESTDTPLVIGILGEDPFGRHLEEAIEGEEKHGRPLVIRHFDTEEAAESCHVLFINLSDPAQTNPVLEKLRGKSILTVSDREGFLEAGGMVQLVNAENKIHFQINTDASSAVDLKISSKLLRVAEVITVSNEP
jgi:hypothetical protein